jgi:hypothetical protein
MDIEATYDHILIREATILARVARGGGELHLRTLPRFYDVRTGVELREIYPALQESELKRGFPISEKSAACVIRAGLPIGAGPDVDYSKVVTILELKQRKLDGIVADSVLDQVRLIVELLERFLEVAENAHKEERFWLSQQVLTLVRKFTGRELSELQEIVEWFQDRNTSK